MAPCGGATEFVDEVGGGVCGTGVVPQECVADGGAVGVEGDHAVLLGGDGDGGDVVEEAPFGGFEEGMPPHVGVDFGSVRVGGTALTDEGSGFCIAYDDLGGLG